MASASPAANSGGLPPTEGSALLTSLLAGVWANKLSAIVLGPSVAVFLWFFVAYQTSPLKKYPGPFLAGMAHARLGPQVCEAYSDDGTRMDQPVASVAGHLGRVRPAHVEAA